MKKFLLMSLGNIYCAQEVENMYSYYKVFQNFIFFTQASEAPLKHVLQSPS